MKGTRLAPRDLWQKLRDRALEMVGRFMRAPGGLVDVARAPDGWMMTKCQGGDRSEGVIAWLKSHCRLTRCPNRIGTQKS
jgi:hypothetical protein